MGAALVPAQSRFEGHVFVLQDGVRRPDGGAWARARVHSSTIATAAAGPDGAFVLEGLPAGRIEIDAVRPGYYTYEADGVPAHAAVRQCPESGLCGKADFTLAKGAVLEGRVSDLFGDAVSLVRAALVRQGARPTREQSGRFARYADRSDDQGRFRLFGLEPGRYRLEFQHEEFDGDAPLIFSDPHEMEIRFGEDPPPVYATMRPVSTDAFGVRGTIQGLALQPGERVHLSAMSADGNQGSFGERSRSAWLRGGQVDMRLPGGDYFFRATISSEAGRRTMLLGRRTINSDIADLELHAIEPAHLHVHATFDGEPPSRTLLRLEPLGDGFPDVAIVNGRRGQALLWPGRYSLRAAGDDWFLIEPPEISISEGQTSQVDLVLSNRFARIFGVVRDEDGPGAFQVGLVNEQDHARSAQTDEGGRFSFAKLRPGRYRICAWRDLKVQTTDKHAWAAAGDAVKGFTVEPGDETEILLTAAP